MVELCLMASCGCPPALGFFYHTELGFTRISKGLHRLLHFQGVNHDFDSFRSFSLHQKQRDEWKLPGGLLDRNQVAVNPYSRWPELVDFQLKTGIHPDSLVLSVGIVEQCTKQEKISKLLSSIEAGDGLLDPSLLHDLMGPQQRITDPSQLPIAASSTWCFSDAESHQSLVYPTRKLWFNAPLLDLAENWRCYTENEYHPDCQLLCNCIGNEMKDILHVPMDFYASKDTIKPSERTMLVPYFERRRRIQPNTGSLKLATEKAEPLKGHGKVKGKATQKRKMGTKTSKEREIYGYSYVHACESLLSIIFDRKQQGKSTILSVKRSAPQLPQLLTQFSATIAGAGIAVILSVACRVACSQVSFCASKLLSSGLGMGLVWLSWAIMNLRNTVISISKSSGKLRDKEEEMMNHLDRNLKDIYFGAAALAAVAMLRLA